MLFKFWSSSLLVFFYSIGTYYISEATSLTNCLAWKKLDQKWDSLIMPGANNPPQLHPQTGKPFGYDALTASGAPASYTLKECMDLCNTDIVDDIIGSIHDAGCDGIRFEAELTCDIFWSKAFLLLHFVQCSSISWTFQKA